jgi:hypothetical protein
MNIGVHDLQRQDVRQTGSTRHFVPVNMDFQAIAAVSDANRNFACAGVCFAKKDKLRGAMPQQILYRSTAERPATTQVGDGFRKSGCSRDRAQAPLLPGNGSPYI